MPSPDMVHRNNGGLETRVWLRASVPIYKEEAPAEQRPLARSF